MLLALLFLIAFAILLARITWRVCGWADPPLPPLPADPPRRSASKRPAVVLVHGICGFDSIGVGRLRVDYFRRVAAQLEAAGFAVTTASLPPLGSVPARAHALAQLLDRVPDERVTMIAHSMGGLDARWAIAAGAAPRIETLITIGTPHGGTPIADLLARGPMARTRALAARIGLSSDAIEWLTTWHAAALDRELGAPMVREACVVAATLDRARIHPLLRLTHAYLARRGTASDGLVPAASQRRGDLLAELEVDHWAQVGWSGRHDAAALLLGILQGPPPARLLAA